MIVKKSTSIFKFIMLLIITNFSANSLHAKEGGFPHSDKEFALLPVWCKVRLSEQGSQAYKNWEKKMGAKNFIHIHHLCAAKNILNSLKMNYKLSQKEKLFYTKVLLQNTKYVEARWSNNFYLMPDVKYTKAAAYYQIGDWKNALNEIEQGISLNKRYPKAYRLKARILLKMNRKDEAIKTINDAILLLPKSRSLKKYLKRLEKEPPQENKNNT